MSIFEIGDLVETKNGKISGKINSTYMAPDKKVYNWIMDNDGKMHKESESNLRLTKAGMQNKERFLITRMEDKYKKLFHLYMLVYKINIDNNQRITLKILEKSFKESFLNMSMVEEYNELKLLIKAFSKDLFKRFKNEYRNYWSMEGYNVLRLYIQDNSALNDILIKYINFYRSTFQYYSNNDNSGSKVRFDIKCVMHDKILLPFIFNLPKDYIINNEKFMQVLNDVIQDTLELFISKMTNRSNECMKDNESESCNEDANNTNDDKLMVDPKFANGVISTFDATSIMLNDIIKDVQSKLTVIDALKKDFMKDLPYEYENEEISEELIPDIHKVILDYDEQLVEFLDENDRMFERFQIDDRLADLLEAYHTLTEMDDEKSKIDIANDVVTEFLSSQVFKDLDKSRSSDIQIDGMKECFYYIEKHHPEILLINGIISLITERMFHELIRYKY